MGTDKKVLKLRMWWQSEPDVGRVAHGNGRVHRLKHWDSIVPKIAEEIGRAIMKNDKKNNKYSYAHGTRYMDTWITEL